MDPFYIQAGIPTSSGFGWDYLFRVVWWNGLKARDGSSAYFHSYVLLYVIRWYHGSAKVDGSKTQARQSLGHPDECVDTDAPSEMWAFRISTKTPDRERYLNMGGI